MKRIIVMSAIALFATAGAVGAADTAGKPPSAAQWAALAKLPDWSGIWEVDWRGQRRAAAPAAGAPAAGGPPRMMRPQMKLKPQYQAMAAAYRAGRQKGENIQGESANCVPPGLPGIMTPALSDRVPVHAGQGRDRDRSLHAVPPHLHRRSQASRRIRIRLSWVIPIGHWEGDTLVVDSVGFNDVIKIAPGAPAQRQMHIVERIRKVDRNGWRSRRRLDDPEVLAEPSPLPPRTSHLDDDIREYICLENNHDSTDERVARASVRRTRNEHPRIPQVQPGC